MFTYDNEYTEKDWRHEADARELAELDRDRRDLQEWTPAETAKSKLYLQWGPLAADSAGPIGVFCDESPIEIPVRKVA